MKHVFLILLAISAGTLTYCQTKVSFSYDDSGNRESRTTILLKSTASLNENPIKTHETFNEEVGKHNVIIYPNPVKSELTVEIQGLIESSKAVISLFDQGGRLMFKQDYAFESNILSLSNLPSGNYFLIIFVDGNSTQWKVVKE